MVRTASAATARRMRSASVGVLSAMARTVDVVPSRQRAQREFGHREERAERAGGEFRQVVAGDVLHDAAAGFEAFAFAVDRRKPSR